MTKSRKWKRKPQEKLFANQTNLFLRRDVHRTYIHSHQMAKIKKNNNNKY